MPPGQTSNSLHVYLVRFISLKQYNLTSYILKGLYVLVYCYLHLWLPSYSHLQLYLSLWLYYLYLYWTATVPSLHQGRGLQQPSPISSGINEPLRLASPCQSPTEAFFHLIRKRINKNAPHNFFVVQVALHEGWSYIWYETKISSFSSFSSLSREDNHILILTQINKQKKS